MNGECISTHKTCFVLSATQHVHHSPNRIKNVFAVRDEEAHLSSQVTLGFHTQSAHPVRKLVLASCYLTVVSLYCEPIHTVALQKSGKSLVAFFM